ncbi:hypothetical protein [uncultured Clostridium sp.]|jgi:outer membrane lipoprotein-sorting protein|uniref:hypothetical protein n=1 Tax=uncultured Clostridium sp. TaxID=59620 RepID=UPI00261CCC53|nr:hypothetical protein [uncultured Clostridium sp.]
MRNLSKRKKLAIEAITLIKEFESVVSYIRKSNMKKFEVSDDYRELSYIEGEMEVAYSHYLDNVSEIYSEEVDSTEKHVKTLRDRVCDVKKFVNNKDGLNDAYVDNLMKTIDVATERCEEIYDRLKQIELEATYIMK